VERNSSKIFKVITNNDVRKRDASVVKVTANGMDDRVRYMAKTWNCSLHHHYHASSTVETTFRPVRPPVFLPLDESTGIASLSLSTEIFTHPILHLTAT
jgi:hypothetical protein